MAEDATLQAILNQLQQLTQDRAEDHALFQTLQVQNEHLTQRLEALSTQFDATPPPGNTPQEGNAAPAAEVPIGGFGASADPPFPPPPPPVCVDKRRPLQMGERFGGNKAYFQAWKVMIEHKLATDQEFLGDGKSQFMFINAELSPAVQQQVAPYFETGGYGTWDPLEFLNYLSFCYSDVHSKERALVRLDHLRQGKRQSFMEFFIAFSQTLAQAGGLHWADEHKLGRLRNALNDRMREVSMNRGVSRTDYDAAVLAYKAIAVDLETAEMESTWRSQPHRPVPVAPQRQDRDGDVHMVNVGAAGTASGGSRRGPAPDRENWIPADVFSERKAAGVCTRCGRAGHYMRACPNAAVTRSVAIQSVGLDEEGVRSGN